MYFALAILAGRIERSVISGPMVFDGLSLYEAAILALVVICTVFLSLVTHGISANPLAKWLGRKEGNPSTEPAD